MGKFPNHFVTLGPLQIRFFAGKGILQRIGDALHQKERKIVTKIDSKTLQFGKIFTKYQSTNDIRQFLI